MRATPLAGWVLLWVAACGGKSPPASTPKAAPSAAPERAPRERKAEPESPPMESDDLRVLLPRDQVAEYFRTRKGGDKPGSYFAPTRAEIDQLEAALPGMIRDELRGQAAISPPLWERVKGYKRQYVPFVEAGGARWIWGNFMCANPGRPGSEKWRNKVVRPDHGGDCFFDVEYSPDTGKFRRFEIKDDD
ncbi:MAG: hypothetical protein IT377_21050 [Polyangiaceae bacterium]|nr:hypothetical protein [Polyangiaceae bacterium]